MWRYHPQLLAVAVPRYTSFPTAAEFGDTVGPDDMHAALDALAPDDAVSLYLHVPYCEQLCWYCGCNTGVANRTLRVAAYMKRLGEEIDLLATRIGGRRISRIAWGGGSPNAISPAQFDAAMAQLRARFDTSDAQISVELDPRGFDWRWAAAIERNRVTRVSLGVQTLSNHVQAAIGRVQPIARIACVMAQLRTAGVGSVNFDLMYGLPGQSRADLAETLEQAIAMAPDRLAVFGYAHVPHLIPRQRQIDDSALPDAEARFRQAELAHFMLTGVGYRAIGFDHFALPGDAMAKAARAGTLKRNFQGFTEDPADALVGLGASAISAFPGWLLQNEKNSGRYHLRIGQGQFAIARGLRRSAADRAHGRAIEQLLCQGQTDLAGLPELGDILARLAPFEKAGVAARAGSTLRIAPGGVPYARAIAATIDPYRAHSTTRFSSAV
ncbi:MAG: oxygen-independent coproporphyrinogen III oxidase [Sphingomonas sp.]|nr:oxygen-independent coproporphyrinogen III oxidase [Sphingomonas sp.]MBX9797500.1 oxygen-independent coproporphyrinogen III oxidase [Sphingomonas sp.]